ncbi:alpha/beta hydrolase [Sphingobium sp. AN641]|uniref:alpha/beta hydrolase n=1 Tax=Sphingobium sp. AN641 TaxID=3133443 RepID=UPI0030C57976
MKPTPDVLKFSASLEEAGAPNFTELSIEQARAPYREQSAVFGGPQIEMATVEDLAAEGPLGSIPLRHYRPHGLPQGSVPALIYIHGGGWVIGDLESHDRICRQLAQRTGCAVVAVDYRLAPEHPAPASSNDVIAAFWWIVANAYTLGIDPERIAVGGDSAGGSLSAVVAIAARDANFQLCCQVLIYPGTDNRETAWNYPSRVRNAAMPPLTQEVMKYFLDAYLTDETIAAHWHISPLVVKEMAGLCPALVITAGCDVLHDEGSFYAERLEQAGVEVMRRTFPGMIHGFIELGAILPETFEALDMIALMLRQRLTARS